MVQHFKMDCIFDPNLMLYLPLWKRDKDSIMSDDAYGHLVQVSSPLWTLQGRSFNGEDDEINAGNPSAVNITGQISVGCWFKPAASGSGLYRTIIAKRLGGASNYQLYLSNAAGANQGTLNLFADSNNDSLYVPPANLWTCAFVTVAGGVSVIYVNGQTILTSANSLTTNAGNLYFGRPADINASDKPFSGSIGETLIYNRALTPPEILQIYLTTKWRYQ